MRPDEHKRKKNEAYKRKHGVHFASKEGKHKESTEKTKGGKQKQSFEKSDTDSDRPTHHNHHSHRHRSHSPTDRKHELLPKENKRFVASTSANSYDRSNKLYSSSSASDSEDNDKDVGIAKMKKKTYRKRQIVSNWQKYELEPSEEYTKVSSRGENFNKLVSMAGNALSHFRFKDELEWELDVNINDMKSSSQLLTIDPAQLAQSLSCIPVHKVLGITSDVFTTSQIEEMMEDAERNRKKCLSCEQETVPESVHKFAKDIQSSENSEENNSNYVSVKSENVVSTKSNTTKDELKLPKESQYSHAIPSSSFASNCDLEIKSFSSLSIKDEELDSLLGIDSKENIIESSLQDKSKEKTVLANTKTDVVVSSNLEDDLEDWLDSVLDA